MPTCCVYKCENGSSSDNACQSFPLPPETSPNLRREWLDRINRKDFTPTENARVCKIHFADDAFIPESENKDSSGRPRKRPRLKPLAIPTLHMKPSVESHSNKRKSDPIIWPVWPCKQTDDHNYVQKKLKLVEPEAVEAAMPQKHDHSYQNSAILVEVIIIYLYFNFLYFFFSLFHVL